MHHGRKDTNVFIPVAENVTSLQASSTGTAAVYYRTVEFAVDSSIRNEAWDTIRQVSIGSVLAVS
jgi:hypothetical protein